MFAEICKTGSGTKALSKHEGKQERWLGAPLDILLAGDVSGSRGLQKYGLLSLAFSAVDALQKYHCSCWLCFWLFLVLLLYGAVGGGLGVGVERCWCRCIPCTFCY